MVFTSLNRPAVPDFEERYPALRIVLLLWKVLVVLFAGATVVTVVRALTMPPEIVPAIYKPVLALVILLAGVFNCVMLWAMAELVEVIMDIEENTRKTPERTP